MDYRESKLKALLPMSPPRGGGDKGVVEILKTLFNTRNK
jgi:hypothetical protein